MQTSTSFFQNSIKQGENLRPSQRVIAEWNHNRYTKVTTLDNYQYPEEENGYDLDMYPIEEVVRPLRPRAGLLRLELEKVPLSRDMAIPLVAIEPTQQTQIQNTSTGLGQLRLIM